jgi:peroxiredoxin Q/BCP
MKSLFLSLIAVLSSSSASAAELKEGDSAPVFSTKTHEGKPFDLASRKGHWTVLYFYPKAQTPGCTKQACAFRDSIKLIRDLDAEVYGVSSDDVEEQAAFHKAERLNFTLLADADLKIISMYGTKMPVVNMAKRWTFVIDPQLKIRAIDKDVDPVLDAKKVAALISKLKS